MKLEGKTAIITGADSGIGQATADLFAREGADLLITYHTDEKGCNATRRLVENHGRKVEVTCLDVGDPTSVESMFAKADAFFGAADVLVANAGIGMGGMPVEKLEDETLEQVLRVNLMGPAYCARAFVRQRKAAGGKGRLVVIGSVAGHLPTPGSSPYGMSKAGVNSLVRSLSVEVAPDQINVNAIAPCLIETPMTQKRVDDPKKLESSLENIPWGRVGQPHEIAGLALFLASDDADYVTGQTFVMDGGLTMNWGGA